MTTHISLVAALITGITLYASTPFAGETKSNTNATAPSETTAQIVIAGNSDEQNLNNNKCLQSLNDNDKIVVSAAFHEGAGGFRQLKEFLAREPWGYVADLAMKQEIDTLIKQESPFLIVTMTKKQALLLESHRDLIKWILVQSTEKACV